MGALWTLLLNGGLGVAAYLAARDVLGQPRGWPRVLGTAVLGWAWLTIGMEILGASGVLTCAALLGWVGLGLVLALVGGYFGRKPSRPDPEPRPNADRAWGWEGVAAVGLVVWAAATLFATSLLGPVKVVSDAPIYHLYFAARWWKAGRLPMIATPFGESAAPYFPAVGDLWFTWLMVGWGGERLAKVGQAPFLLVTALSAYALARRLGAERSSSLVATAWFASSTPLLLFSGEANVDTVFVAAYLLTAFFYLRHATGDDGPAALVLGSLAAGCALATKPTGLVFVPPLLVFGLASALLRGTGWRSRAAGVLAVGGGVLAVAGFWYGRNLVVTGNPLYPLHLAMFGRVWLAGWFGPEAMRFSQYYLPVGDVGALGDILLAVLDPRLVPVWVAALAGAWAWGARGRGPGDRWVWAASGLAVLNVALYWLAIPYRTQQRFMLQALGLTAVPLARTFDRSRAVRAAGVTLLAAHLLTHQSWPFGTPGREPPWDLSRVIPNGVPGLIAVPGSLEQVRAVLARPAALVALAEVLAVGAASLVAAWAWSTAASARGRVRAGVASVAVMVVSGLVVYPWGMARRAGFYPYFPDYLMGWLQLEQRAGPSGVTLAYAGTNIPFYLMGMGLRNEVRYVNIDAHPGWLLHDYHRAASRAAARPVTSAYPRPDWDRIHPDYSAWLSNLHAKGIQLLVVTRANPVEGPHNVYDREGFPIECHWADTHPETFEPLYGSAERDPQFRLYRLRTRPKPPGRWGANRPFRRGRRET
jgi:hypothetical protein